jgi:hypothetical protein
MKAYRMPERMRARLKGGKGTVVEGADPLITARRVSKLLRKCSRIWAVGDLICESLLLVGVVPDVCIVDGRTKRKFRGIWVDEVLFNEKIVVKNPPGHITDDSIQALKELSDKSDVKALIIVNGEEDLLALLAIIYAKNGECVVFGLPNRGVEVVHVDDFIKKEAINIFNSFEEVTLSEDN